MKEIIMNKQEMTAAITAAKEKSGMTWVLIATAISKSEDKARALGETLALGDDVAKALQVCPHKHCDKTVPTDPLVYRFYEMINVYGDTIKALIHEKFGDCIMSAIDFTMDITKEEIPIGDRVVITLNGKFLPYKAW